MVKLDKREKRARSVLIEVAQAKASKYPSGKISYKDFWEILSKRKWGRARTREIVTLVTRISAFEISRGRPPLNELVVTKRTGEPGEPWESIEGYLRDEFGIKVAYSGHGEAMSACWRYWQDSSRRTKNRTTIFDLEVAAEEGLRQDRTIKFRKRNSDLIAARKLKDKNTCQSCGFFLKVKRVAIIDCHHRNPLGWTDGVRITSIDELVCLCPTCHRIAHSERYPLTPEEIKAVRRRSVHQSNH